MAKTDDNVKEFVEK
ncbi:hypothetical protein HaLaN_22804 [Haematococcus lacustris]|uniref:Uncharacterized protein n=1 Tax=Haematococcus lacustris TaxID=44745 RepID=A0A6A0A0R2_HAELA|nr:hypothetical protein HaLaN_22804 [Haematococcus lacustris]